MRENYIGTTRLADRRMTSSALGAIVLGAALAASCPAAARAPAPLIPTALVEDVKSAAAGVEFMDYVGTGQVIKLEPADVLVLSYLRSCEHETITGGTVRVGPNMSEVAGGKITRNKVPCNGGNMKLSSAQANASGASSFRVQDAALELTVYALSPIFEIPKLRAGDNRTLVIERTNGAGERIAIEIDESLANGGFYDLGSQGTQLKPGAHYAATLGDRKLNFKVDGKAASKGNKASDKTGRASKAPIVSRLLRFPPA
jgi:hypothetical protein